MSHFLLHIDTFHNIEVIPMIFPCKFLASVHFHIYCTLRQNCLIDFSFEWKTGCGSENREFSVTVSYGGWDLILGTGIRAMRLGLEPLGEGHIGEDWEGGEVGGTNHDLVVSDKSHLRPTQMKILTLDFRLFFSRRDPPLLANNGMLPKYTSCPTALTHDLKTFKWICKLLRT